MCTGDLELQLGISTVTQKQARPWFGRSRRHGSFPPLSPLNSLASRTYKSIDRSIVYHIRNESYKKETTGTLWPSFCKCEGTIEQIFFTPPWIFFQSIKHLKKPVNPSKFVNLNPTQTFICICDSQNSSTSPLTRKSDLVNWGSIHSCFPLTQAK